MLSTFSDQLYFISPFLIMLTDANLFWSLALQLYWLKENWQNYFMNVSWPTSPPSKLAQENLKSWNQILIGFIWSHQWTSLNYCVQSLFLPNLRHSAYRAESHGPADCCGGAVVVCKRTRTSSRLSAWLCCICPLVWFAEYHGWLWMLTVHRKHAQQYFIKK